MDKAQKPRGCPKSDQEDPEVTRMGLVQDQRMPVKSRMRFHKGTGWRPGGLRDAQKGTRIRRCCHIR